jgi:hypothetical protein
MGGGTEDIRTVRVTSLEKNANMTQRSLFLVQAVGTNPCARDIWFETR